jgi:hypothetical protein
MDVAAVSEDLLTAADAAALLYCPLKRLRRYRAEGLIRSFYVGTQQMFRRADVTGLRRHLAAEEHAQRPSRRHRFGSGRPATRVIFPLLCDTAEMSHAC